MADSPYSKSMEIDFAPDTQAKIDRLVLETGRGTTELLEDALAGYSTELGKTRSMLDGRYDDIRNGRVKLIDGEEAFSRLMVNNEADRKRQRRA
jgi:hypothetical protein